jgi:hypothetical protein
MYKKEEPKARDIVKAIRSRVEIVLIIGKMRLLKIEE